MKSSRVADLLKRVLDRDVIILLSRDTFTMVVRREISFAAKVSEVFPGNHGIRIACEINHNYYSSKYLFCDTHSFQSKINLGFIHRKNNFTEI